MAKKNPRVDAYIAKSAPFAQPILRRLRKVVHAGCPDVQETLKWSFPHFEHRGMMCGMAAFKNHCTFGFWKASLVFGEAIAEREAMGHFGRITTLTDLPSDEKLIALVQTAAALNEAGITVQKPAKAARKPIPVPSDFKSALEKNAKARSTFENFSPSKRRDYLEWVTEAKRDETRAERLAKAIDWLAEGKARNWKYEPKSLIRRTAVAGVTSR